MDAPPRQAAPLGSQLRVRHCLKVGFSMTGRKGLRTSHTRMAQSCLGWTDGGEGGGGG